MFGIGPSELLLIFLISLLLFGGKRLPEIARSLGQAVRVFQEEARKLRQEFEQEAEAPGKPIAAKPSASAPAPNRAPEAEPPPTPAEAGEAPSMP